MNGRREPISPGDKSISFSDDMIEGAAVSTRVKVPIGVFDFDAANAADPYQVSEYAMDIFDYFRARENDCRIVAYMAKQLDLNASMRVQLVDWMVTVHECFGLNHDTLYSAVKYVDMFLNKKTVKRANLQLLGAGALFIASKYDVSGGRFAAVDHLIDLFALSFGAGDVAADDARLRLRFGRRVLAPRAAALRARHAPRARLPAGRADCLQLPPPLRPMRQSPEDRDDAGPVHSRNVAHELQFNHGDRFENGRRMFVHGPSHAPQRKGMEFGIGFLLRCADMRIA